MLHFTFAVRCTARYYQPFHFAPEPRVLKQRLAADRSRGLEALRLRPHSFGNNKSLRISRESQQWKGEISKKPAKISTKSPKKQYTLKKSTVQLCTTNSGKNDMTTKIHWDLPNFFCFYLLITKTYIKPYGYGFVKGKPTPPPKKIAWKIRKVQESTVPCFCWESPRGPETSVLIHIAHLLLLLPVSLANAFKEVGPTARVRNALKYGRNGNFDAQVRIFQQGNQTKTQSPDAVKWRWWKIWSTSLRWL